MIYIPAFARPNTGTRIENYAWPVGITRFDGDWADEPFSPPSDLVGFFESELPPEIGFHVPHPALRAMFIAKRVMVEWTHGGGDGSEEFEIDLPDSFRLRWSPATPPLTWFFESDDGEAGFYFPFPSVGWLPPSGEYENQMWRMIGSATVEWGDESDFTSYRWCDIREDGAETGNGGIRYNGSEWSAPSVSDGEPGSLWIEIIETASP